MQYWMHHQNHHSAGTPIDCSCLICSGIAENDEVVAVEDFIDVGNILGKIWVSLLKLPDGGKVYTHQKMLLPDFFTIQVEQARSFFFGRVYFSL